MAAMFLDELEAMAAATALCSRELLLFENDEDTSRWQKLFAMSPEESTAAIRNFREDRNRIRLTDEQWHMMAANATDHNKESFEYYMTISKGSKMRKQQDSAVTASNFNPANPELRWIFIPTFPLDTTEKIRAAFPLCKEDPKVVKDEISPTEFVLCDNHLQRLIIEYLRNEAPAATPTFVPHSLAAKRLAPDSVYPTLGVDTTMPQFRSVKSDNVLHTATKQIQQHDYPVVYFFYGTLSDPERLARLLNLNHEPKMQDAHVHGGVLKEWTGSSGSHGYKALVNGPADAVVPGSMFEVQNQAQEMALRNYETARYDVVRCLIKVEGRPDVCGLTFRFVDCGDLP